MLTHHMLHMESEADYWGDPALYIAFISIGEQAKLMFAHVLYATCKYCSLIKWYNQNDTSQAKVMTISLK